MRAPVGRRYLVFDQVIDCLGVRYSEQCFGQTHEADALFRGQAVFIKESLHHRRIGFIPNASDDPSGFRRNRVAAGCLEAKLSGERTDDIGLGALGRRPENGISAGWFRSCEMA